MIGVDAFAAIEEATDRAADDPWSDVDTNRFRTLIAPLSAACRDSLPAMNPIGLPTA
jgi:hypothetical protein